MSTRRRRCAGPTHSRCSTKRSRGNNTLLVMATETIELETSELNSEEVVDLTCEVLDPAVVDLTNNDSLVIPDEAPRSRHGTRSESYVLSSDEEADTSSKCHSDFLHSLEANSAARAVPGTISCPICMDTYVEIVGSGRIVVSTKCGHIFCSVCLRDCLAKSHSCPTCRKKLTHKQYHPIYI